MNLHFSDTEKRLRKQYHPSAVAFIKDSAQRGVRIVPQDMFFVLNTHHDGQAVKIRFLWEEVYGKKAIEKYNERQKLIDARNKEVSSRKNEENRKIFLDATGKDLNEIEPEIQVEPMVIDPKDATMIFKQTIDQPTKDKAPIIKAVLEAPEPQNEGTIVTSSW